MEKRELIKKLEEEKQYLNERIAIINDTIWELQGICNHDLVVKVQDKIYNTTFNYAVCLSCNKKFTSPYEDIVNFNNHFKNILFFEDLELETCEEKVNLALSLVEEQKKMKKNISNIELAYNINHSTKVKTLSKKL